MAQSTRELNVNINVDITETIRGLKAIQREAKKAAQALRELEAVENGSLAMLHACEIVIPRDKADEFAREAREIAARLAKAVNE
jgi:multidrug efflux pump subunit AcrB